MLLLLLLLLLLSSPLLLLLGFFVSIPSFSILINSSLSFKFESIVDNTHPVSVKDENGIYVFINKPFTEKFGLNENDIISKSDYDFLSKEEADLYRKEDLLVLESGEAIERDVVLSWGGNKCFFILRKFLISNIEDSSNFVGIVSIDITVRKKAEALIKESNEELDAFVHTVAHDLRTPLTPIIGYAEILRENYKEQLDEQGLSYLTEIEKAGIRMVALMEDLLSLAASGIIKRPIKFVSTDKVVERVIKNLETNISAAGAILQINPLPPIHIPKTFLAQIFDNLIGNALRYAGNSGDFIEVGGEQAGKQIRFFVRDHGTGISEQERKHIFEIFYRGTNKGEVKGSGIGLAIVYKIARNYGGRAWVEETPGGGCTFWVEVEDEHRP
jgi:PAS domain S-box-containing protein